MGAGLGPSRLEPAITLQIAPVIPQAAWDAFTTAATAAVVASFGLPAG